MYSYLAPFLAPSFSSLSPRLTNPSFQLRQDTEGQAATLKELEEVGTLERFMKKEHPAEQCAMASVRGYKGKYLGEGDDSCPSTR